MYICVCVCVCLFVCVCVCVCVSVFLPNDLRQIAGVVLRWSEAWSVTTDNEQKAISLFSEANAFVWDEF